MDAYDTTYHQNWKRCLQPPVAGKSGMPGASTHRQTRTGLMQSGSTRVGGKRTEGVQLDIRDSVASVLHRRQASQQDHPGSATKGLLETTCVTLHQPVHAAQDVCVYQAQKSRSHTNHMTVCDGNCASKRPFTFQSCTGQVFHHQC